MPRALIGHTGFVGSTLLRQAAFDACYRSTDIDQIAGRHFELIVCAGAPAQKWLANQDPESDRQRIARLIEPLRSVTCDRFVLISTVDVFADPQGVDERSPIAQQGLHAYGRHRYELELFVQQQFSNSVIVRLPGLVGPGLRKNVLYDLVHLNNVQAIDTQGVFQFYPMVSLWPDLERAMALGHPVVHLTAEPVSVAEVCLEGFGRSMNNPISPTPARYDMRSRYAADFGANGAYQYSRRESLLAIRAYAQSEPRSLEIKPLG